MRKAAISPTKRIRGPSPSMIHSIGSPTRRGASVRSEEWSIGSDSENHRMRRHMGQRIDLRSMTLLWRGLFRFRELVLAAVSCAVITAAPISSVAVSEQQSTPKQYQFTNGRWFDGEGFRRETFYVVNGLLTRTAPARVDEIIDLRDGFVVPPFGEAHNHNVEGAWNIDAVVGRYLEDGVFYVKIPGNI